MMNLTSQHPTIESKLRSEVLSLLSDLGRADIADIATQVRSPTKEMRLPEINKSLIGIFESLEREGIVRRAPDAEYFINGYREIGYKEEDIKLFTPYEII